MLHNLHLGFKSITTLKSYDIEHGAVPDINADIEDKIVWRTKNGLIAGFSVSIANYDINSQVQLSHGGSCSGSPNFYEIVIVHHLLDLIHLDLDFLDQLWGILKLESTIPDVERMDFERLSMESCGYDPTSWNEAANLVFQGISLTGFQIKALGSSKKDVLGFPDCLFSITDTSQSRQHVARGDPNLKKAVSSTTVVLQDYQRPMLMESVRKLESSSDTSLLACLLEHTKLSCDGKLCFRMIWVNKNIRRISNDLLLMDDLLVQLVSVGWCDRKYASLRITMTRRCLPLILCTGVMKMLINSSSSNCAFSVFVLLCLNNVYQDAVSVGTLILEFDVLNECSMEVDLQHQLL
ncbi:hypothetical protein Tco_0139023 [Tanacetum coccineum]